MRILIVSRTPWDNTNSFGNTFSNIFGGMPDIEIYNICCQAGVNNNNIVRGAYQMTDSTVLRSIAGKSAGCTMGKGDKKEEDKIETRLPHKRITLFYICRELLWKAGHWKSKSLDRFIDSVKPDLLYLPIYRSGYMVDVQKYIIRKTRVPSVAHITDDIYGYAPDKQSNPLKTAYQTYLRNKIRGIMRMISYGEVFAADMASEYKKEFGKEFYLIGKGINVEDIEPNTEYQKSDTIHFVYTGNYGGERGRQLVTLAESIRTLLIEKGVSACLDIYSTTQADSVTDKALINSGCVNLCGGVNSEKLRHIQRKADFLVHVEGFSPMAIYESRLSFSTKIIDYLLAQRPILAIGPIEVNSIKALKLNNLALIASDSDGISKVIETVQTYQFSPSCAIEYLKKNRDISLIQSGILQRMKSII